VKRLTIMITPDGRWVLEDSADFRTALGDPNPDYDSASFAVMNLGFIKFQMLDDSVIEIELHPRNVELPALLAVQQQLLSSTVKLFRIKYFVTSWQSEILPAPDLAVSRLSELCAPKFAPPARERFLVEPQDYFKLYDGGDGPLQLLTQKWRASFAQFDPSVISFAIKQQLLSRIMIFGIKPGVNDPVFRFIGDGFRWLANDYQFYGIGEYVQNQPDKDYGGWVSGFYKSVASTGQPRYDHVTAAIERAPGEGKLFMTRYERLLLPWKTSSDEVFVSMLSRILGDAEPVELDVPSALDHSTSILAKSS
jgi:hypothetical protein